MLLLSGDTVTGTNYYVSNQGNDSNDGTISAPFKTIAKLLNVIRPGDTGYIREGVYDIAQATQRSGSEENPVTIKAYGKEHVVLQGDGQLSTSGSFRINHDWYVIEDITFYHGSTGMWIRGGSHNKIINCKFQANYYTGLVISGDGASYNSIINCDACDMYDSGSNGSNADGFAITGQTSTPGPGNEFVGCRSYNNSDDGFDVWKAAYPVKIISCMAYNNGNHDGDGNGFKLGINKTDNDKHYVERCMAWNNRQNGFDYNDNSLSQTLYNCIAYNNGRNYKFFAVNGNPAVHDIQNCISVVAVNNDILLTSIIDLKINSWNFIDKNAANILEDNFVSINDSVIKGERNADGSIPENDFLKLKPISILMDKGVDVGLPFNGSAPDLGPYENAVISPENKIKRLFLEASSGINNDVQYIVTGNSTRDNSFNEIIAYYTEQFNKINVELIDNACSGQSCKSWMTGDGNYDTYLSDAITVTKGNGENTVMEFSFGLNDWDIPTVPELKARLGKAIGMYLDAKPEAVVILAVPVTTNNLSFVNILKQTYEELADSLGLPIVNVRIATDSIHGDSAYYHDGTHPNKWGSRRIVNFITDQILPSQLYSVMTLTEAPMQDGWMSIDDINKGLNIRLEKDNSTFVEKLHDKHVDETLMFRVYPNPFYSVTTVKFTLPRPEFVFIDIIDMSGRRVMSLIHEKLREGEHKITFNSGSLPAGTYICRLKYGNTKRSLMFVKVIQ